VDPQDSVQSSAAKTLTVLAALAEAGGTAVGVTDLALEVGLPKSTAHRLLKVLEERGFVSRVGTRYRIGGAFFELSEVARWSDHAVLRDAAYRPLVRLFERSEAIAVHLGVLRGTSVFYVDKLMRPEGTRLPSRVGGRFPATCTGLGKAMLAFSDDTVLDEVLCEPLARPTPYSVATRRQFVDQLAQARADRYAVEREEACHGTICVAAPILHDGVAVAALSLTVSSANLVRSPPGRLAVLGKLVADTAAVVSGLLPADEDTPPARVPAGGTQASSRCRPAS
jgi:DNA-binding IclR family transcriptional regulator